MSWRVSLTDETIVLDEHGYEIAAALGDYLEQHMSMAKNAALIAAAPDLLAALKDLMEEIIGDEYRDPIADAARAAIAKAETI